MGLAFVSAIIVCSCIGASGDWMGERDAKDKYSHAQVAYEHPAKGEDHCGECRHYIKASPMRCEIVRNPIRAEDWCRKFAESAGKPSADKAY